MKRDLRRGAVLGLCLWTCVSVCGTAFGQAQPALEAVFPEGGQRGQTTSLTFRGRNIGGADGLIFSAGGIAGAELRLSSEGGAVITGGGVDVRVDTVQTLTASVTISAAAPIGVHTVRLRTPQGVSTARTFVVGNMPELREAEPNTTLEQAQEIALPATVSGVVSSSNDADAFRFTARRGMRLICEALASRMGSPLDTHLTLYDAAGKEVARNDISRNGLDSEIDAAIPADGTYTLRIRDSQYRGGGNYTYRLSVGALPRLDGIFPLGGRRGSEIAAQVQGRNLGGVSAIRALLAPDAPLGFREMRVLTPSGYVTNAALFAVDELAESVEKEPNDRFAQANGVGLPSAVNGRIEKKGDRDWFKFQAKAGQRLVLETFASRLGSPLDALLTLHGPTTPAAEEGGGASPGARLAVNDDAVGSEARFAFTFPADGEYSVELRDLSARGGPDFAYRLRLAGLKPDFNVSAAPADPVRVGNAADNGIARVSRGGSAAFLVNIGRLDGFGGALRLEGRGLPPDFAVSSALLAPGGSRALMTVTAPPDAELATHSLRFAAYGSIGGRSAERVSAPILLTALPRSPFRLELAEASASVLQDQDVRLNVLADRSERFSGQIALTAVGLPPLSTSVMPAVAPGADRSAVTARAWNVNGRTDERTVPAAGEQYVTIRGTASVNGVTYTETTPAVRLRVLEAPFVVRVQPVRQSFVLSKTEPEPETAPEDVEAASGAEGDEGAEAASANGTDEVPADPGTVDAELTLRLVRRGGFTGAVAVSAVGLPEGLTADSVTVAADSSEAKALVRASRAMKAGDYTFHFVGKATINGRAFQQITSTVTAKIIE